MCQQVLRITPQGMINGHRREIDGVVYFGYNSQNTRHNDFTFVSQDPGEAACDRFIKIYYNASTRGYFLSGGNYSDDYCAVFIKVEKPFSLTHRCLVSLGQVHLSIDIKKEDKQINIETIQADVSKSYSFAKEKRIVKVGRSRENDIVLESSAFSRVHTQFVFREEDENWYLVDGNEGKPSTNGSWILLNFDMKIDERVKFRLGSSLIQVDKI